MSRPSGQRSCSTSEYSGSDPDRAHWRSAYPTSTSVELREVRGRVDLWVAELSIRYDEEGPWSFGLSILEFRGERIARESIYVAEGWEAPEWRAKWRAAP